MDRVKIYEYDRKNRERIVKVIEEEGGQILSWSFFAKEQKEFAFPAGIQAIFIDLSRRSCRCSCGASRDYVECDPTRATGGSLCNN